MSEIDDALRRFEAVASRAIDTDGNLAGYYVLADDWRAIHATIRTEDGRNRARALLWKSLARGYRAGMATARDEVRALTGGAAR